MSFQQELNIYLRARFTLIILVTQEEERAIQTIKQVCLQNQRPCISWDVADGFISFTNDKASFPTAKDALTALEQIDKAGTDALFILKDFHDCWKNDTIKRKLRSVAQRLKMTKKSILVTSPLNTIPPELKDEAVIVEFPLPKEKELEGVLNTLEKTPGVKLI